MARTVYVHLAHTVASMVNQPKTQHRSVRVPDDLWREAKWVAEQRGETAADVIRRALRDYVASWPGPRSGS